MDDKNLEELKDMETEMVTVEESAEEIAAAEASAEGEVVTDVFAQARENAAASLASAPGPKSKKRHKDLAHGNAIAGLLFVAPFIIGFLLFLLYPLGLSFAMTFCKVDAIPGSGLRLTWNNFDNYNKIFRVEPEFTQYLWDEVKRMALFVPGILVFSFFMAILLNQEFKGRAMVRVIYFLPVILSAGIFVGLESNNALLASVKDAAKNESSLSSITTTLENILLTGETGNKFFQYVIDIVGQVYDIAMASGIQIIIFLSGLQTIPPSMFEAAKIEGCTSWESFWKITFPLIGSMILVNVVYTLVDFFTRTDSQLMTLFDQTLLQRFEYGKVAAMSWVYFMIIAVILGIVMLIFSRRVYYYD